MGWTPPRVVGGASRVVGRRIRVGLGPAAVVGTGLVWGSGGPLRLPVRAARGRRSALPPDLRSADSPGNGRVPDAEPLVLLRRVAELLPLRGRVPGGLDGGRTILAISMSGRGE